MRTMFYLIAVFLTTHSGIAQVLYTENFDSYTTGNINTDYTGAVAGTGGWYTKSENDPIYNLPLTNNDYKIATETNRGNIAEIGPLNKKGELYRKLYRTDLKTYWQQRTPGNNVLKITFDMYVDYASTNTLIDASTALHMFSKEGHLLSYRRLCSEAPETDRTILAGVNPKRGDFSDKNFGDFILYFSKNGLKLPLGWVTLEMYIDYDNSKAYFSLPHINYTFVKDFPYTLSMGGVDIDGNPLPDDSPVELMFSVIKYSSHDGVYTSRIDNINISAQSAAPALGVNHYLAKQFNLFPNPANSVVTITNAENISVNKITVYDVLGKLLTTHNYTNETEIQLNVEHLQSGTYLLHLETNEGIVVKKLVKK